MRHLVTKTSVSDPHWFQYKSGSFYRNADPYPESLINTDPEFRGWRWIFYYQRKVWYQRIVE